MNDLARFDICLRDTGSHPERFPPGEVRNRNPVIRVVDLAVLFIDNAFEGRKCFPLSKHFDIDRIVLRPDDARCSLHSHEQPLARDLFQAEADRHSLVCLRVVSHQRRVLLEASLARHREHRSRARILECACHQRWRERNQPGAPLANLRGVIANLATRRVDHLPPNLGRLAFCSSGAVVLAPADTDGD